MIDWEQFRLHKKDSGAMNQDLGVICAPSSYKNIWIPEVLILVKGSTI